MSKLTSALFCLSFLLLPAAASAQSLTCALLPSLCQESSHAATAVPELDANAAGTAGALVLGATLLMTSRRRRQAA
jgi:hypothetical protein